MATITSKSRRRSRIRPKHLFFAVFALCLFFFWSTGFRQRPIHDVGGKHHPVAGKTRTEVGWFSRGKSAAGKQASSAHHPIPKLMEDAQQRFDAKLARQSKSLEDAVLEYRRRYQREPPKGFEKWWAFASDFDVKMVDEYDILMEDLAPFYELPGTEIRRRVAQVGELPSIDLVRIRSGVITVENVHWKGFMDTEVSARARGFARMMGRFAKHLPDMDFPINAKAEGRVLIPWEHQHYPNLTRRDSSGGIEDMLGGPFQPDWGTEGNVWEAWRRTCDPKSPARRLLSSKRMPISKHIARPAFYPPDAAGDEFSFASGTSEEVDYCQHPHSHHSQGHFFADWRTIPVLYPVFSPARAAGFMDIRIPSHYYYGSTKGYTYGWDAKKGIVAAVDKMEKPWSEKIDQVFWRGATTGGGSHPAGFTPQYQRHRFLRMTSDTSDTPYVVTFNHPPHSDTLVSASVPVSKLNEEIMDTAFVKVSGMYPGGLAALMEDHRFSHPVPLGRHWSYKYLVDLDGMSYSGRFMAFLASDSAPIKATVYTEFFSDWIEPWLHYIPLSTGYKEIYNIHSFFSGPTRATLAAINATVGESHSSPGDESVRHPWPEDARLRKIAEAGKDWKRAMGRTVDMEVYVYRLCLEWARLWADDRDSMDYDASVYSNSSPGGTGMDNDAT